MPRDINKLARAVVEMATGEKFSEGKEPKEKNLAAVALSKLGASKGGKARADKLTPEQRKEIARKAAKKRWSDN